MYIYRQPCYKQMEVKTNLTLSVFCMLKALSGGCILVWVILIVEGAYVSVKWRTQYHVLCTLCWQFLWILHFWLAFRYSIMYIYRHIYCLHPQRYFWNNRQNLNFPRALFLKNGESRETANIEYTRRGKPKQQHNTICVGHHYAQTKTNNVENTRALLQTNGGKDEPTIVSLLHVIVWVMVYAHIVSLDWKQFVYL
jgi:hypothetical protein